MLKSNTKLIVIESLLSAVKKETISRSPKYLTTDWATAGESMKRLDWELALTID